LDAIRGGITSRSPSEGVVEVDISSNGNGDVIVDLLLEAETSTETVLGLLGPIDGGGKLGLQGGGVVELKKNISHHKRKEGRRRIVRSQT
jgi:hypothetical protein